MTLYPKQIMDALATVRYPGTGKNVVEMNMVEDDLRIAGLHVSFSLILTNPPTPSSSLWSKPARRPSMPM